jgi:hypothetical protein
VPESLSHLTIGFAESAGGARFCFEVSANRACDPATSPCCAAKSPTRHIGIREFSLKIGARRRRPPLGLLQMIWL